MAKKVQLQTNGKEWQVIDGEQVLVDVEKQDIDPITSSSCVQIEGFRTLEEAVSDNKMLSQDLTYTKVMDKVGGDYHQNVLDGQYSKAILYGNTQVNLCEEDSSNALQIPTTFTSFNNGELQIKNKESQVVAPLIKGVTMVNLAQINSSSITSGNGLPIHNVKGNTLYTLSFKFTTKNTNSGVVIQSYDANGAYIENTMHKTGLGDVVKFTFTTHANATKIHICNNAAYGGETIQLDEIMLIEGDQTALDIPFFKGMKSVELSRPLENLFRDDLGVKINNSTVTNSGGTVTVTSSSSTAWSGVNYYLSTSLKQHTKYLVMWESATKTHTATANPEALISVYDGSDNTRLGYINNNSLCPTQRSLIFDTEDKILSNIVIRIHATQVNTETGTTTVKGLRVFEYDDYLRSVDLQSIGYFSGTKNVAVEPVKTCSKNLYPYGDINFTSEFADSWCDAKGNAYMTGDIALKSKSRFLLKKGTYCLSHNGETNILSIQIVDDKENLLSNPFTLKQDTYCTVRIKTINANTLTTVSNIQIERGETATDYVTHDSRYYEPDGQNAIVLRSLPDGVCDTFNLQTGEYTRRIGEVVFNGTENQSDWQYAADNGTFRIEVDNASTIPSASHRNKLLVLSDKLNAIKYSDNWNSGTFVSLALNRKIVFRIDGITNVTDFVNYLSQNPVTVQYELDAPITTIIPRTVKKNNNGTVSTVDFKTYTNKENLRLPSNPTFLTINSMTSIKPIVEPITYIDFKTRLKANTDYSVIMDKDSTDKTINLGGTSKTYADKMLVRTPSIDLEQNLRISGSGTIQNIMVIEGDVLDKGLPYFNGMCNVKMPIVRNMGRNLLDNNNVRVTYDTNIILRAYPTFPCKPGKRYVYCVDKLGTESACNWYSCKRDAVLVSSSKATGIIKYLGYSTSVVAPPDCKYLSIYTGGSTSVDPYSVHAYVYEVDTLAEAQAIGYTDYKENQICLVQGEIGLSQDMFEQGGMRYPLNSGQYLPFEDCKADSTTRIRTKECIPLKPGVAYRISCVGAAVQIYFYDASKKSIEFDCGNTNGLTFTTPNGASYMSLMFRNDSKLSVTEFMNKITLQILELDSTIQLRSLPNGVKDELNLLTGEYIQRVGEVVLDGSEGWKKVTWEGSNNLFDLGFKEYNAIHKTKMNNLLCDKLEPKYITDVLSYGIGTWAANQGDTVATVAIRNGKETLEDFKASLASSPVTLQYELAEPIISYPRIVSNTQEREVGVKLPNGVCDTYNPSTGITVKRVGKVILDGSEDWILDTTKTNTQVFKMPAPKDFAPTYFNLITESLPTSDGTGSDTEKIVANQSTHSTTTGLIWCIYIALLKTKASTVDELKTYLSSNPLTVYYELANPIVTTDIVLPNGVHGEYNPETGVYTKKVGFIEFDGSETKLNYRVHANGYLLVDISSIKMTGLELEPTNNILSNVSVRSVDNVYSNTNITTTSVALHHQDKSLMIRVVDGSTTLTNVDEYTQYLSQNPIKLWYELQTPITYQLTPYFGLPMPYAYKDGYLIMDSAYNGQTLPPEITYQLTINRTGQITQNNIKLKEHTDRLSNLEYILIEATLDSIFDREMQNFELELMNIELFNLDE